jgi:alcohol dehydrogenase
MSQYSYTGPQTVLYGIDSLDALPDQIQTRGAQRVLLLTTTSLADKAITKRVETLLGPAHVGTFSRVVQHVPTEAVTAALDAAKTYQPDLLVTLGGGSVTDTAKAISIGLASKAASGGELYPHRIRFTYPDTVETDVFTATAVPIIAIPTTASAAEYDGIFGMTTDGVKDLYLDPGLVPSVVILDPAATLDTPERLWLASGIKALDHAVETFLSRNPTPVTDGLALHAIDLLATHLPRTRTQPDDLDARLECLVAGWLSMFGVADVTLGLSHGIGHQVGALCGVPHGETSCIMLPVVLDRVSAVVPARLARVGAAFGTVDPSAPVSEQAEAAVVGVRSFIENLGLPTRLSEVGVTPKDFGQISEHAMADMVVAFAPVTVDADAVTELLSNAL